MTLASTLRGTIVAVVFVTGWSLISVGSLVTCCTSKPGIVNFWRTETIVWGLIPLTAGGTIISVGIARRMFSRTSLLLGLCVILTDYTLVARFRRHVDDTIGAVWHSKTGVFDWGRGEIRLPEGLVYKRDSGMDTLVGHFVSPDGALRIDHDIGELAAEHGGMGPPTATVEGARVRLALRVRFDEAEGSPILSRVSFPDNGCAQFSVYSTREGDAEVIASMARSFRPAPGVANRLRMLLPEFLRQDCRYRFHLPWQNW